LEGSGGGGRVGFLVVAWNLQSYCVY
jgi:hypothetical protein